MSISTKKRKQYLNGKCNFSKIIIVFNDIKIAIPFFSSKLKISNLLKFVGREERFLPTQE